MAGIIDIRYIYAKRMWEAKPRFAYDKETLMNGAPAAYGMSMYEALDNLCNMLPAEMANSIRLHTPRSIYHSPERDNMYDRCVDVDGYRPTKDEYRDRRSRYLFDRRIRHD